MARKPGTRAEFVLFDVVVRGRFAEVQSPGPKRSAATDWIKTSQLGLSLKSKTNR